MGKYHSFAIFAKELQDKHFKVKVKCTTLEELDYFVGMGIQPSNIQLLSELEGD